MLLYNQKTGELSESGVVLGVGYAGAGEGRNNPSMQAIANVGPLPVGVYDIDKKPFTHKKCGVFCLRLTPRPENEMYSRAGFIIHGDSKKKPGQASNGCPIFPRDVRAKIASGPSEQLKVISGE